MEIRGNDQQTPEKQEEVVDQKWQGILDKLDRMMERQMKNIEDNPGLTPEHKVLLTSMMQSICPVLGTMSISIIEDRDNAKLTPTQKEEVKELVAEEVYKAEDRIEQRVQEQGYRVQCALVEDLYKTDRILCRQRFRNMRIRGLGNDVGDLTEYVLNYACNGGVSDLNKSDIEKLYELRRRNTDFGRTIMVTFSTVRARNLFVEAKHNHIKQRKELEKNQAGIEDKQSQAYSDLVKGIREKKRIKVSEDLTPLRAKLLAMVRRQPGVKDAFTRDGLIHVITIRGKVFIDSACDLYKLGIYDPSYDELGISASICGITMKPDMYEGGAENQEKQAETQLKQAE